MQIISLSKDICSYSISKTHLYATYFPSKWQNVVKKSTNHINTSKQSQQFNFLLLSIFYNEFYVFLNDNHGRIRLSLMLLFVRHNLIGGRGGYSLVGTNMRSPQTQKNKKIIITLKNKSETKTGLLCASHLRGRPDPRCYFATYLIIIVYLVRCSVYTYLIIRFNCPYDSDDPCSALRYPNNNENFMK